PDSAYTPSRNTRRPRCNRTLSNAAICGQSDQIGRAWVMLGNPGEHTGSRYESAVNVRAELFLSRAPDTIAVWLDDEQNPAQTITIQFSQSLPEPFSYRLTRSNFIMDNYYSRESMRWILQNITEVFIDR